MIDKNFHHNFELFFDGLELPRQHTHRSEHMSLQAELGLGTVRRIIPRKDMEIVISEYTFHQDRTFHMQSDVPMVELSFCIQGTREVSVSGLHFELVPGSCILQFLDPTEVHFSFERNKSLTLLGIGIPVSTFHHFMEGAGEGRTIDFHQLLGKRSFRMFQGMIEPTSTVILNRILQAAQSGSTRNIEMECHVLDLLSTAFRSFLSETQEETTTLTKQDMEKIRQARDIMMEHMADPPKLTELSRMIGMNDYKLKVGFKELYENTVFGYLREQRLEKSLLLLQEGRFNVNEVSCAVGYSNPSYFAEAFRNKFGVNPGEFTRRLS
ncbi:AraC family transcriptional regulator [Paenibacillus selenitireducens]|uniref:AraC family transcriptional regulator n=1 Tax=Paenibacillus selenitireducens TaxID=1324314 RepID=A0A1T2X6D9_9BACL|nr:AraC family transcriptional regulator [Paenibacillus selenitireducens]OPA75246.1 AraC family transcriptional regulator [Paenibacillus selenitireducens]